MTNIRPELSRRIAVGRIPAGGLGEVVEAGPAECRALAERLRLPAVSSLVCRFHLEPALRGEVAAEGELRAEVTQICVVTLEPFESAVSERFVLRFVPQGSETDDMDPDAPDEIPYAGDVIDIGEAAAEQLALALDPYPRKPGVSLPQDEETGALADEKPNPFATLARLRNVPPSGNA